MTRLSKRITGLNGGGSDGWEIMYQARTLAHAGQPVIDLTVGDHDIRTDDQILDAMDQSARGGNTGYAAVPGSDDLRDAIATRVTARTGVPTGPENVLVTPGGQAALFAAMMGTIDPGDRVLFIDPYYATYPGTIRSASGQPVPVPARAEDGFQPDAAMLEAAGPARTLLINTPNNPTGALYSRETLDSLGAFVTRTDMWLISDEVYDTQVWEGDHISPRALPNLAHRCLVVGSLSKSHRMTGARLGWIVGPATAIAHLSDLATNTTYGVPGFIQDAAVTALTNGHAIEQKVTERYRSRRTAALAAINGSNDITVVPSAGAMYLMLNIRQISADARPFAQALLDDRGIAVMPGESFGSAAAGHVRVALTRPEKDLTAALAALADYARGYR